MKARIMMLIMAVALVALPTMAQQEWQSTSAMQGSGSAYSAQVTAVGATGVTDMASTTTSTPNNGPRRAKKDGEGSDFGPGGQTGGYQDPNFPIGDAWPLALFAALFAIVITIKNHKKTIMKKNIKSFLFIAALVMSNSAWGYDTYTIKAGTYIFDFSGCVSGNQVWDTEVFVGITNANSNSYSSSNVTLATGVGSCNDNNHRDTWKRFWSNDGKTSLQFLIINIAEDADVHSDWDFFHISAGAGSGSHAWKDGGNYQKFSKEPVAHGGRANTFYIEVSFDGSTVDYNWRTSATKSLPDCMSSTPILTFSYGPNGSITLATAGLDTISSGAAVAAGTSVNLVATPNTGYAFYCWSNASGDPVSTNANYVFSMPSSSYSLTASFYADNTDPAINGCAGCFRVAP